MTNDGITQTEVDGGAALPAAEAAACVACEARSQVSAAPALTGALLWLCPLCGRAWPTFAEGDRGAMARGSSDRLNRLNHRSQTP
jgi:hypothetical protein